ncbi:hypothetical protein C0993_011484 [Termitomyces sp. T159_Od127]|nr:hypothetical protein C0993_011484 [Termitomyces sp. T159_Od127]
MVFSHLSTESVPLPAPTVPHFNAKGGLIYPITPPTIAIVPPLDTSEDVCYNSDDLELQYPEPEHEVSRTSQPLTTLTGYEEPSSILAVPFPVYGVPHHLPSFVEASAYIISHPLPVPRPTMSKLSPVQRQNSTSDLRPRPPKAKSGRRCITPDCNATLHIDSTTLRCFLCVKKEWQSKLQVHADARSARPPKKRKTVTWSDVLEVDLCARENASTEKKGTGNSTGRNTQTPTKLKIRIPAFRTLNPSSERSSSTQTSTVANSEASGCREIPSSSTSPSSQPTDDSSISTVSSSHLRETPPTSIASTSPIFSHSRINHIPESPLSRPREPDPSATAAIPDPATSSSKSENTLLQHISGWDSDLSDLTDPQESDVEQLLSDEEPTHKRPIIKIRIPARPASVLRSDGTLCSIPQCRRILPEGYRWKCCIQCRLHHREYQRKRLNIQGKHKRLDDEVDKESESRHDSTAKPPPDLLTPGARLCMVKNCTQIIPSPEDYPWKMCESCRIQRQNIAIMRRMKNMGGNPTGLLGQRISEAGRTMLADECSESESESEGVPLKRKSILKVSSPANVPKSTPETVKRLPAPKKTIPPYTEYICWSSLLDVFHKRVAGFLEAHRCYKRFKQTSQPAQAVKQASFKFEGEYSVVALDFKVLDRKPEVHRHTMRLKDDIGHAGDLLFL